MSSVSNSNTAVAPSTATGAQPTNSRSDASGATTVNNGSSNTSNTNNNATSNNNRGNRNRRRGPGRGNNNKGQPSLQQQLPQTQPNNATAIASTPQQPGTSEIPGATSNSMPSGTNANANSNGSNNNSTDGKPNKKRGGKKKKNKNGPITASTASQENGIGVATTDANNSSAVEEKKPPGNNNNKKKTQNQRRRNNKNNKNNLQYPWKKFVPEEAVDPITLDPLLDLKYPPFALVADEPYEPVEEWPVPDEDNDDRQRRLQQQKQQQETEEQRQRRIIAEQWGKLHSLSNVSDATTTSGNESSLEQNDSKPSAVPTTTAAATTTTVPMDAKLPRRHFNLYDGRALAYYMVSQLQFIDPLNRRDLTRDELVNLDRYLRRHGFHDLNVTEAYDAKGITLSTAGAVANTAAGRAAILQQEASLLLQALFGGLSAHGRVATATRTTITPSSATYSSSSANQNNTNSLLQQYQAHEQQYQQQQQQRQRQILNQARRPQEERGIFGAEGFWVIDEDQNPGLRSTAPEFIPSQATAGPNTLWSASHITGRHSNGNLVVHEHEFPELSAVVSPEPTPGPAPAQNTNAQKKPPSKTLEKIGSAVKKTDPEELQRMFEAREEARRRAMLSNMTYGSNPAAWNYNAAPTTLPTATTLPHAGPTETQLERNRAFAEALGVLPSTLRGNNSINTNNINSGWARPSDSIPELDEFGNELNTTVYPDSLILQARDKMDTVLKVERKWKTFLADDTAASLPLNRMDRPTRAMVHEYSDYWKLRTESFDPEPKRYIHCVKLRDTRAPYPLLSDAVRNWRGPRIGDHSLQQTAGQSTSGTRSFPLPPNRVPLPLKPRSDMTAIASSTETAGMPLRGAPHRSMSDDAAVKEGSRFAALAAERERPKLELQKRTLPLEQTLPPMVTATAEQQDLAAELLKQQRQRAEEKRRREREDAQRKQRLLEAAFASDDEQSAKGRAGAVSDDDSSVWEEPEPLYAGSDDE